MRVYRVSDHRLFDIDGHRFLFLVDESAIYEVEPDTAETLRRWSGAAPFAKDAFTSGLSGPEAERQELVADLVARRVLRPAGGENAPAAIPDSCPAAMPRHPSPCPGERPEAGRDGLDPAAVPLQTLVLHVTDACNLACLYCYRAATPGAKQARGPMSARTGRAAIDFLLDRSGPLKEVVLVFFGGEPFLNLDLVSEAAAYARDQAGRLGKTVQFAVTTNGTLLTPEALSLIEEYSIGVTVSIDGLPETQDRNRPFAGGAPSYAAMLPGLKALLRPGGGKPVVARVTVSGDPGELPRILDHLLELGFAEVGFAPATTRDPRCQLQARDLELLLGQFQSLTDAFLEHAGQDRFLGFSNLVDLLVTLHEGEVRDYPCGAGLGLFSADPQGRLFLCQRLTGQESTCMGDVFRGFDSARVARWREEVLRDRREECRDCWVRRICAGGCYHEALVRAGGLTRPNRHYCRWIQEWVRIGLEAYGRLALRRPEYLERLSCLRGHPTAFPIPV